MYNREKYIGECLDSLLAQTFQDFEVIVIDDCSTDNSIEVVESYVEKFSAERLKLIRMEKNTGHPGEPRNRGIAIAQGEYIYCLDSDDAITETTFEEMYTLGKDFDADVVYCEKYFKSEGTGQEFKDNIQVTDNRLQKPPFVKVPTLETDNLEERVKKLLRGNHWMSPALRIVKRSLLIENGITFPSLVGSEDDIWSTEVFFCAKRFLRIPNLCFIRRIHGDGISFGEYTTPDHIQRWMDITIRSLKGLDNFLKGIEFFRENPRFRYAVLNRSVNGSFVNIFKKCAEESDFDIYNIFQEKFGEYLGEQNVLVSSLCAYIVSQQKILSNSKILSVQDYHRRIYEQEEEIKQLKKKFLSISLLSALKAKVPAISVVIPLFNAEEFISECLDSLVEQTFQDFEVIVVDDCSTDKSLSIVEDYALKFSGRLAITKTESNSGGGGYVPRNIGFNLARGEYVYFLDADDYLLSTALETLYNSAKEYDADVVYMAVRYTCWKPNDVSLTRDGRGNDLMAKGLEDKPTLTVDAPDENLHALIMEKGFTTPWVNFVKRNFLLENKIVFPEIPKAGDYIWAIHICCCAKRYLRLTTPLYFYRRYNINSVSKITSTDQFSNWVLSFIAFAKTLGELSNKIKILRNNFAYCYEASNLYFDWCINRTEKARESLSNQDICEALYSEFSHKNYTADFSVPFLFSVIDAAKKSSDLHLKAINELKKGFAINNAPPKISTERPAISIIIPLYNAEQYIIELLNSILAQTFQNFEVIVVDDCSTDDSAVIVEIYAARFDGRLRLAKTERNSGSPGEPGNIGIELSRGEYLLILDNDDTITPDALEKLYADAKNFDADVVSCEKFYWVPEESWDDTEFRKKLKPSSYQKGGFVKESTLIPFDIAQRVQDCYDHKFLWSLWQKLIRRDFMIENKIRCTNNIVQDMLVTCCLVYTAKNFVRVPYAINFYRVSKKSLYRRDRAPLDKLRTYLNSLNVGFNYLDTFLSDKEFFIKNPAVKQLALKTYFQEMWDIYIRKAYDGVSENEFETALRNEFVDGENTTLIVFLFNTLAQLEKNSEDKARKISPYITARIDIKLLTKTKQSDFQIFSLSDDKAIVTKPKWFQKGGIGYVLASNEGAMTFVAKSTENGQVSLNLKGMDVRDPQDNSKRLPYWIDYTKLTINGKVIFDEPTPAWHDAPFIYNLEVKADEEITVAVEWLPHMGEVPKLAPPSKVESPVVDKFLPYLTARLDAKLTDGDLKIVSISDDKAAVKKPPSLQKGGVGYQIQSLAGKMKLVAKATTDGQLSLKLRGLWIPDPVDNSKLIPYWIDYTKLVVNGKIIFDKVTPTWHNKPFNYDLDAKAGDEITIDVEWLPHMGEVPAIAPPPEKVEPPVVDKFLPYLTARLDAKLTGGDFQIVSISDDKAAVKKPAFLQKDGVGYQIQSLAGEMKLVAKATSDGQLSLKLRGLWVPDPNDNSKRLPYWIDYTKLIVNGKSIFDEPTPVWHDAPFNHNLDVKASDEITIDVEWLPHSGEVPKIEPPVSKLSAQQLTARLDAKLFTEEGGDFQILSVSDEQAEIKKPDWFQKNGVGYVIQSLAGNMKLVAKATANGQLSLKLRGLWVPDPVDNSKLVPYWIDYTKLTVNDKVIFDKPTPAWHDEPYIYILDVKADDEITLQVEWQPHMSDA